MKFLTALLAVVGAVPTVWHAPHQKAPAEGFTKITYQLKIDSLTFHGQGYYGLTQSWLQTGQPIYGGLSINVNGVRRTMFAIFWRQWGARGPRLRACYGQRMERLPVLASF